MAARTQDLNNIFYFAKIVEQGSLSAASKNLGVAKSMLSRHLSALEQELGVRLIQRTTRKLQVTDVGTRYYEHCRTILGEMERASSMIDHVRRLHRRKLRISSPLNFAQLILAPLLTTFMVEHEDIEVSIDITNELVTSIDKGHDLALQIGPDMPPSNLVTRSFTLDHELLVASPGFLYRFNTPRVPADLRDMPSIAGSLPPRQDERYEWDLTGPTGEHVSVPHFPRLVAEDLWTIKHSALAGCGLAAMPPLLCRDALDDGRLVRLLPDWSLPVVKLHAVYHPRRGVSLLAATLFEFLSVRLRPWLDTARISTLQLQMLTAEASRRESHHADVAIR